MTWHWWFRDCFNGGGVATMPMLTGIGSGYCSCHHFCQVALLHTPFFFFYYFPSPPLEQLSWLPADDDAACCQSSAGNIGSW